MTYLYVLLMIVVGFWLLKKGAKLAGTVLKLGILVVLGYLVYLNIDGGW